MDGVRTRGAARVKVAVLGLALVLVVAVAWAIGGRIWEGGARRLDAFLSEDTLAYLSLRDVAGLYEGTVVQARPEDPDIESSLEAFLGEFAGGVFDLLGVKPGKVLPALKGLREVELALTRFDRSGPTVVGLVRFAEGGAARDLYRDIQAAEVIEGAGSHGGLALYRTKKTLDLGFEGAGHYLHFAVKGDKLLVTLSIDADAIKGLVDADAVAPQRSLAADPVYGSLAARAPAKAHSWLYVPARPVLDLIRTFASPREWQSFKDTEFVHGLSTLTAVSSAVWLDGDWTRAWLEVHHDGTTPAYRAVRSDVSPRTLLRAVPPDAMAVVDVGLGDARDLWDRGYAYTDPIIKAGWLDHPERDERIRRDQENRDRFVNEEFPGQLGISILDDVLPALGDELAVVLLPGVQGDDRLPVRMAGLARVRDLAKIAKIESALRERLGAELEWDSRTRDGYTVHAVAGDTRGGPLPTFAYAVGRDSVVLATDAATIDACILAGSGGDNLAAAQAWEAQLARLPGALSWVAVVDLEPFIAWSRGPGKTSVEQPPLLDAATFRDVRLVCGLAMEEKTLGLHAVLPAASGVPSKAVGSLAEFIRRTRAAKARAALAEPQDE